MQTIEAINAIVTPETGWVVELAVSPHDRSEFLRLLRVVPGSDERVFVTALPRETESGVICAFGMACHHYHALGGGDQPRNQPSGQPQAQRQDASAMDDAGHDAWRQYRRSGSCWVSRIELDFHHLMLDPEAPDERDRVAPTPSHADAIVIDARSHCLLWLEDGSPAHARWCHDENAFRRVGDEALIELPRVRAWSVLPYPVAAA